MNSWSVILRPVEHDKVRGLGVFLNHCDDSFDDVEVGRVGFVRSQSINPDVEFADKLDEIIAKADAAAEIVNDFMAERERQQDVREREREAEERDALEDARAKIMDVVGSAQTKGRKAKAMA